jgi:ubiquinone/menaquinone biosynthesis C-methylase UbiE
MNRDVTNVIRYVMDELLPPAIRDNKYFMYPFFYYAFNGKDIKTVMEFKSLVNFISDEEYERIYRELDPIGKYRPTDLNKKCVEKILSEVTEDMESVIDIGCGRGYFLEQLVKKGAKNIWGCDLFDAVPVQGTNYQKGNIEHLPFDDKSFDVVICSHILEHVKDFDKAVNEIKRIAKKKVIVTVPKQRYFYYTLDLHVRFFYHPAELAAAMKMEKYEIFTLNGDFVFVGHI